MQMCVSVFEHVSSSKLLVLSDSGFRENDLGESESDERKGEVGTKVTGEVLPA
jgi:hypothetical protein